MKHIIVIPVFNDWRSLNKLLLQLNKNLKKTKEIIHEVLIINDNSSDKINNSTSCLSHHVCQLLTE